VAFNNSGAVNVQGGTLYLAAGGSSSGSLSVGAGSTLELPAGTFSLNAGASESGAGTLLLDGGILTVSANVGVQSLTYSSGTLNGTADQIVNGALNWTAGTMAGSGRTIVASTGSLSLSGSTHSLQRTLENDGSATWTAGNLEMFNGTLLNNGT